MIGFSVIEIHFISNNSLNINININNNKNNNKNNNSIIEYGASKKQTLATTSNLRTTSAVWEIVKGSSRFYIELTTCYRILTILTKDNQDSGYEQQLRIRILKRRRDDMILGLKYNFLYFKFPF